MKTKDELNALKAEVETLNKKLAELSEEELAQVIGGSSGMDIVERVLRGDYGNGRERNRLRRDNGYDYGFVQNEVNQRLGNQRKPQEWYE